MTSYDEYDSMTKFGDSWALDAPSAWPKQPINRAPKMATGYKRAKRYSVVPAQSSPRDARNQSIIGKEFKRLAREFDQKISVSDPARAIVSVEEYLTIVGLGPEVVPFLIKDLAQSGRPWSIALKAITRERVGDNIPQDKPLALAAAWVRWGREQGHIPSLPPKQRTNEQWMKYILNPQANAEVDDLSETVSAVLELIEQRGPTAINFGTLDASLVHCEHLAAALRATCSWKDVIPGWAKALECAETASYAQGLAPADVLFGMI